MKRYLCMKLTCKKWYLPFLGVLAMGITTVSFADPISPTNPPELCVTFVNGDTGKHFADSDLTNINTSIQIGTIPGNGWNWAYGSGTISGNPVCGGSQLGNIQEEGSIQVSGSFNAPEAGYNFNCALDSPPSSYTKI